MFLIYVDSVQSHVYETDIWLNSMTYTFVLYIYLLYFLKITCVKEIKLESFFKNQIVECLDFLVNV